MSSLERLIKLAQKTGDRLIVHDEFSGRAVVILDVDTYEKLFDRAESAAGQLPFSDNRENPRDSSDDTNDNYGDGDDTWDSAGDVIRDTPWDFPSELAPQPSLNWQEDSLPDEPVFYEESLP